MGGCLVIAGCLTAPVTAHLLTIDVTGATRAVMAVPRLIALILFSGRSPAAPGSVHWPARRSGASRSQEQAV